MYIGQTRWALEHRINQHIQNSKDTRRKSKFYLAMRVTKDPIIWGILEMGISPEDVDNKERYYIKKYCTIENGYNTVKGGTTWYSGQFTKQDILNIYKLLRGNKYTITDIADKYNTLLQTISGINKGEIYKLNGYAYPIRKTYTIVTDDLVVEIVNHLKKQLDETPAEYAKKLNFSRKAVENINRGTSHRRVLKLIGCTDFPIWKAKTR